MEPRQFAGGRRNLWRPFLIPFRSEMETRLEARLVTYNDDDVEKPGGMCACCGGGPNPTPDWRRVRPVELEFLAGFATLGDPWYVYRAGICDADGVYYAMLCEGCL